MRAIIVDDELPLVNELRKLLAALGGVEIVGAYTDPRLAFMEAEMTRPDVAFLDIEMSDMKGFALAEKLLEKNPQLDVLFVTAYNHYASEAFEANAVDYLLKPIRPDRLEKSLLKLNSRKQIVGQNTESPFRIQSFGKFGIYIGNTPLKWKRAKQQELFAYLLQNEGQWVDKYKICDDLWRDSDPGQALSSLQTAIWAIRKALRDAGVSCVKIEFSRDSYILYLKDAVWDLRQFRDAYQAYLASGDPRYSAAAAGLYREGYLFYEDWPWAMIESGRCARQYAEIMRAVKGSKL